MTGRGSWQHYFSLMEPRPLYAARLWFQCLTSRHDEEVLGVREVKHTGMLAVLTRASNYVVYRCRVCGHYREVLQPDPLLGSVALSRMQWSGVGEVVNTAAEDVNS